jgi:hypothetical protein
MVAKKNVSKKSKPDEVKPNPLNIEGDFVVLKWYGDAIETVLEIARGLRANADALGSLAHCISSARPQVPLTIDGTVSVGGSINLTQ